MYELSEKQLISRFLIHDTKGRSLEPGMIQTLVPKEVCMCKDLYSLILTKHEHEIMEVIWARGEATVRDVLNVVSSRKKVAYTTISAVLTTLRKKGAVARSQKGVTYSYRPLLSRSQAMKNHTQNLIQGYFDGDPEKLLEFVSQNMYELEDFLSVMYSNGRRRSMPEIL